MKCPRNKPNKKYSRSLWRQLQNVSPPSPLSPLSPLFSPLPLITLGICCLVNTAGSHVLPPSVDPPEKELSLKTYMGLNSSPDSTLFKRYFTVRISLTRSAHMHFYCSFSLHPTFFFFQALTPCNILYI